MTEERSCETCHFPLQLVQDEPFGRLYVCTSGHWWNQDFKTLFMDRIFEAKGEEKHAA